MKSKKKSTKVIRKTNKRNDKRVNSKDNGKVSKKYSRRMVEGVFLSNARGFGFVHSEEGVDDLYIGKDDKGGAMNKDTVIAEVSDDFGGRRPSGRVLKVTEHAVEKVVGTYEESKNYGFVVPDDRKLCGDLFVERTQNGGAKDKDQVVAEILDYGKKGSSPTARILEVLGSKDDPGIDILSIVKAADIPTEFPERVLNQADRISSSIQEGDFEGRHDIRDWKMVTIDGPDAKDLDDAVSLTEDEAGYTLGVHIADVSNYVQEHSALDTEAVKRGTSVYLADRVIPMLPKKLSNGICSLNAGEDRLALSVIMQLDEKGKVISHVVEETVIRVGERMSYPDVRAILEDHDPALCERYKDYVPMFEEMYKLSLKIRARRRKRGAIDFDFPEAEIKLDEQGFPIEITANEPNCATKLIEDFMLTANETVAEDYKKKKLPFVFRVHEDPDSDKIEDLIAFVRKNNVKIERKKENITPKELQEALTRIQGTKEENLISRVILRSMQQARYSTECTGHFGLAAKYYCHFTSPIRRYPDLQIHRIIKDSLRGRLDQTRIEHYKMILDDIAQKSSAAERRADDAERLAEKLKKAQYMTKHLGDEYDGVISGVTGWGFYVELENTVEGLVRMQNLRDDYYEYDEEAHTIVGRLTGRVYTLGDTVRIRVIDADVSMSTIDFEPADTPFRSDTGHSFVKSSKSDSLYERTYSGRKTGKSLPDRETSDTKEKRKSRTLDETKSGKADRKRTRTSDSKKSRIPEEKRSRISDLKKKYERTDEYDGVKRNKKSTPVSDKEKKRQVELETREWLHKAKVKSKKESAVKNKNTGKKSSDAGKPVGKRKYAAKKNTGVKKVKKERK